MQYGCTLLEDIATKDKQAPLYRMPCAANYKGALCFIPGGIRFELLEGKPPRYLPAENKIIVNLNNTTYNIRE